MTKLIECSICSARIEAYDSHNAEPFARGRCCADCNENFVIPLRINNAKPPRPEMDVAGLKILNWLKKGDFKLEKPQGSSMHHMRDYVDTSPIIDNVLDNKTQIFVVEHDWYGVIPREAGDFILPYPCCAFEFRVSGMRVISICANEKLEDGQLQVANYCNFIGCDKAWVPTGSFAVTEQSKIIITHPVRPDLDRAAIPLYDILFRQIRAVCIMLEANVAAKQTIRAPEQLNRQREKRGRIKLSDYHVVTLNRKPRPEPVPTEWQTHSDRNSPRLHFRRGHWRHLITYRTWINWQLVGNPDLGFVDKHYRLT